MSVRSRTPTRVTSPNRLLKNALRGNCRNFWHRRWRFFPSFPVLAETRSDRQRLGERSGLVSDWLRLRSSSPSSSASHQGTFALAFCRSTIALDVAFANYTPQSKHRDLLAAR